MKKYIKPEMDVMNIECGPVLQAASSLEMTDDSIDNSSDIKARPQFDIWGADPVEE